MIDKPYYELSVTSGLNRFEFVSHGVKGEIIKVVSYQETNIKGVYNLGFGDKDLITGYINDLVVTNNGDMHKVLATIVRTLYSFIDNNPDASIMAIGSTKVRTRLYRIGISNNLLEIQKEFYVYGLLDNKWEFFCKGIDYTAFLVQKIK